MGDGKKMPVKTKSKRDDNLYERRFKLALWLSQRKTATYNEIAEEFHISQSSVKTDLDALESTFRVPLERRRGKKGISISDDKWSFSKPHLLSKEQEYLLSLKMYIPEELHMQLDEIIRKYGNPAMIKQKEEERSDEQTKQKQ